MPGVVLDQAGGHIHPEAVAAHGQPEPHHILDGLHRGPAVRRIGGLLPGLVNFAVAVVQRRLALEKVQDISGAALALPAHEGHAVSRGKAVVGPDIPPGILVFLRFAAGQKPGMLLTGMARHQVQQHMDTLFVGGAEQLGRVLVGAVTRGDLFVIPHIIACILEGGIKAGIDPDGIAAQFLYIVQLRGDTRQIPDAVPVGIVKTLGVNLVKDRVLQPRFHT